MAVAVQFLWQDDGIPGETARKGPGPEGSLPHDAAIVSNAVLQIVGTVIGFLAQLRNLRRA